MQKLNGKGMHYKDLNQWLKAQVAAGEREFLLENINGQRYLGTGISADITITVQGTPGSDLGAFLDGHTIIVQGNGQDAIGNTMNAGKIVIHGQAGDVLGYAMRGGKLFIRGSVGYRVGIHMKEYQDQRPVMVIGGSAGDFLGEYMAGGILVVLGLDRQPNQPLVGELVGTGMHGGVIYLRGEVDPAQLGKECSIFPADTEDLQLLRSILAEYCQDFSLELDAIMGEQFFKLRPVSTRPYGQLYVG